MRRLFSQHPEMITIVAAAVVLALGIPAMWLILDTNPNDPLSRLVTANTPLPFDIREHQQPLYVENVQVEINPAATQPLMVYVYAHLADPCYRMRIGVIHYHEQTITASLYMGFRMRNDAGCFGVLMPISVAFPLDIASLPPGDYTLSVNGWSQSITITPELIAAAQSSQNSDSIGVDDLQYFPQDDAGRPFIRVQGRYPIDCPYIIGVVQQTDADTIELSAHAATVEFGIRYNMPCQENYFRLPETMPLDIPLDLTGLPTGEYTLTMGDKAIQFNLDSLRPPPTPRFHPTNRPSDPTPLLESYPTPLQLPVN
jgi:hypothetical protein